MYVFDTETCGLHGPIILIQYQKIDSVSNIKDNDSIVLHNVWHSPIQETLDVIENFCNEGVIAFNLVFDWFHICQLYTTLYELGIRCGFDAEPVDYIDKYAELEPIARDGNCVKPRHALDLMLYARKGPYQSTMERKNIVIRRVPTVLAKSLQNKLDKAITLDSIYFARRREYKEYNWDIETCNDDVTFSNLTLRFKPSIALKVLAQEILGIQPNAIIKDIIPKPSPLEHGWAPFALALSNAKNNWRVRLVTSTGVKQGYAWPGVIRHHISHWEYNKFARIYARNDIVYTRDLYYYFRAEVDDDDSILAAQVGAARWKGYAINKQGIERLRENAVELSSKAPKAPKKVFEYIAPYLSETEKSVLQESTKRSVLETLADALQPCTDCDGQGCEKCKGTGNTEVPHPAAKYAKACLDARKAKKEIELYDKLLEAGRFHASLKIIGTLSSRMSGADGLNPQGIKHDRYVREQFPLASPPLKLIGGDFMSFEVSIIDAICNDPKLRRDLSTCAKCKKVWPLELYAKQIKCPHCGEYDRDSNEPCRQKFHGLFAMGLAPGKTYDEIIATKGTEDDLYDKGKRGGFSQFYGGTWETLVDRLSVSEDVAQACEKWFNEEYKGSQRFKDEIFDDYCSMRQPEGIGTRVEWHDPKPYVESLLGFRRYFTIENTICHELFKLANALPKNWKEIKIKCIRRDREQSVSGALMSALYAAAFSIQAKNMRAAANHRIQSTGATILKELQCKLWELQPIGVSEWRIQPLNIHDELMVPIKPGLETQAKEIVDTLVESKRDLIPLIAIGWSSHLTSWADK